jgi:hypothetical protein
MWCPRRGRPFEPIGDEAGDTVGSLETATRSSTPNNPHPDSLRAVLAVGGEVTVRGSC